MQHAQHFYGDSISYGLVHYDVRPSDHPAKVYLVSKQHLSLGLCTKNITHYSLELDLFCVHGAQCLVLETGQTHNLISPWIHKTAKDK